MTTPNTLTPDQQKASDAFFNFLMSDASVFVLSGGPGVGKSFLMSHICKTVMKDYEKACTLMDMPKQYETLSFTATTNKAAEVLEASIHIPVQTIHSFLGLKVSENHKTGKTSLTKTQSWKVRSRYVVFIDEASMIDTALREVIEESFTDSKIIYVGDHAQMCPVGETTTPVFLDVDPDNFIFLSQPVRNAGSPALVALCAQLRRTVETGVFYPIMEVPGSIEYLDGQQMQQELDNSFKNQEPSSRILCYTNSRVEHFNSYIREIRNLPEDFVSGDTVVAANAYANGAINISVERELQIQSIGTDIFDAGYADLFQDKVPVQYRHVTVTDQFSTPLEIRIPVNKERWQLAIKEMARLKNWSEYFELKSLCADLRFKTACTVYKSQGSTYESVFVDLGNIGTSYDAKQVARMLLVAVSRATSKVFLFGRLPPAYQGAKAA